MPDNSTHVKMLERLFEVAQIIAQAERSDESVSQAPDSQGKKHSAAVSTYDADKPKTG